MKSMITIETIILMYYFDEYIICLVRMHQESMPERLTPSYMILIVPFVLITITHFYDHYRNLDIDG